MTKVGRSDSGDGTHAATQGEARLATDEASFRFALNEDAMATEKLSEGIRLFAKDLRALRAMVSGKLG